jgi:hypothetical protein
MAGNRSPMVAVACRGQQNSMRSVPKALGQCVETRQLHLTNGKGMEYGQRW